VVGGGGRMKPGGGVLQGPLSRVANVRTDGDDGAGEDEGLARAVCYGAHALCERKKKKNEVAIRGRSEVDVELSCFVSIPLFLRSHHRHQAQPWRTEQAHTRTGGRQDRTCACSACP
jgi:hypothetical protein